MVYLETTEAFHFMGPLFQALARSPAAQQIEEFDLSAHPDIELAAVKELRAFPQLKYTVIATMLRGTFLMVCYPFRRLKLPSSAGFRPAQEPLLTLIAGACTHLEVQFSEHVFCVLRYLTAIRSPILNFRNWISVVCESTSSINSLKHQNSQTHHSGHCLDYVVWL